MQTSESREVAICNLMNAFGGHTGTLYAIPLYEMMIRRQLKHKLFFSYCRRFIERVPAESGNHRLFILGSMTPADVNHLMGIDVISRADSLDSEMKARKYLTKFRMNLLDPGVSESLLCMKPSEGQLRDLLPNSAVISRMSDIASLIPHIDLPRPLERVIPTPEEFEKRLVDFVGSETLAAIRGLKFRNYVIAGGSISRILDVQQGPIHWEASDIDIFTYGTHDQQRKTIGELCEVLGKGALFAVRGSVITVYRRNSRKIQIVSSAYLSPDEIIANFDLSAVMVYMDAHGVWANPYYVRTISTRIAKAMTHGSTNFQMRVAKLAALGYSFGRRGTKLLPSGNWMTHAFLRSSLPIDIKGHHSDMYIMAAACVIDNHTAPLISVPAQAAGQIVLGMKISAYGESDPGCISWASMSRPVVPVNPGCLFLIRVVNHVISLHLRDIRVVSQEPICSAWSLRLVRVVGRGNPAVISELRRGMDVMIGILAANYGVRAKTQDREGGEMDLLVVSGGMPAVNFPVAQEAIAGCLIDVSVNVGIVKMHQGDEALELVLAVRKFLRCITPEGKNMCQH